MRDLGLTQITVKIKDGISGDVHEFYVRKPTNKELASYPSALFERKGSKIINKAHKARLEYGTKILSGFKKGTLGYNGSVFSSDPTDPDYKENWKDLIVETCPDIITAIAIQIFESTGIEKADAEIVIEDEDETSPL